MAALREGRDSSVNFESAFRTFRVVLAIDKAIEERRTVRMEELPC